MRVIKRGVVIISVVANATSLLLGANVPNIDNIIKEVKPPKEIKKSKEELIEIEGKKRYQIAMVDDKSGKKIYVKEFKITGNVNIKEEELKEQIKEYERKSLNFKELTDISSIITKYYRDKGYFVARAYLPVQDVKKNEDVFEIAIIEGEYNKFNIINGSRVKDGIIQKSFDRIKEENNVVNTQALERSMLIVDDYPGVKIRSVEVKPGEEIGSSSFDVIIDRRSYVDGYVVSDNYGNKYSGRNRIMGGVSVNSALKIADELSMFGVISEDANLKNGMVTYSVPLNYNGLRGEISYSNTNYDLRKIEGGYNGDSKDINVGISYPIIKTREDKLDTKITIGTKKQEDYQDKDVVTNKELKNVNVSMDYVGQKRVFGLNGIIDGTISYVNGDLNIKNEEAKSIDEQGAKTQGRYNKIEMKASLNLEIMKNINFVNSIKAQQVIGNKNLDGTEDMSIGGIDGVKFYPSSEESAENGYVYSSEIIGRLPNIMNVKQSASVFYDVGKVRIQNNEYDTEYKSRLLEDVGLGYYMNYREGFVKIYSAWGINAEVESETNYNNRIMFQAGISF